MKILIIGPEFFSYKNAISLELNSRKIPSFHLNELHSGSTYSKMSYRLGLYFLIRLKIKAHREKICNYIKQNLITDVIFISPESIDSEYLSLIKSFAKVHLYMWDGFKNKHKALSVLDLFDTKSSFDKVDCENHLMNYIPLFAEDVYIYQGKAKMYDLTFCGTVHSDRSLWLTNFKKLAKAKNLKIGLLIYYYTPLLLFIRLVRNKFNLGLFREVSFQGYSKKVIANMFRESRVIIDLTHPNQIGLTSRTFEALRTGSKLVTNNYNCDVLKADFGSRIFLLNDIKFQQRELLEFIKLDVEPLTEEQDRFLSIKRFTDQLLDVLND